MQKPTSVVTAFSTAVETILTEMYLHVEVPFTDDTENTAGS